jgi:TRAP-type C4-dicarboxylate transport system substrate-binding protein
MKQDKVEHTQRIVIMPVLVAALFSFTVAIFADRVVVLFANSDRWNELPESARTEILELLERQLEQ